MVSTFIYRLALVMIITWVLTAQAQSDLGQEVQTALATGQTAMQIALSTYERHYPDLPLWREAIRYGKQATTLAPDNPEALSFLAEAYSRSSWPGPAWQTWNTYLDKGFSLDEETVPLFIAAGGQLGYTRYSQGQMEDALEVYRRVLEIAPDNKEANVWSGRILLETGRPAEALPYWENLASRDSSDERAAYFLQLTQNQIQWGAGAATAFQEGISLYEKGQLQEAALKFSNAAQQNPNFTDAYIWSGRTLLDLGRPAEAVPYWQAATERNPNDTRSTYFLQLAQDQSTWGPEVANAFRAGVQAYETGDLSAAASQFERATSLRGDYAEAWAWRGRVAFEQGNYNASQDFYSRASSLQPTNETYRYFFEESERRAS